MNSSIVRWALVAAAAAALVVIGIVLLTGNDTGAQLSPSASQAQTQQNAPPAASATAGELDTSFGGDGKVVTSLTRGSGWALALGRSSEWASALAIQADGKIVIAGDGVARYSSDGKLDTSFSGDGKVMTGFLVLGVAVQADGKIVVVGSGRGEPQGAMGYPDTWFALARYDSDGTLDASFGVDGKVRTDFIPTRSPQPATRSFAGGVAIQADGKIVVVGNAAYPSVFALARYNSDGTLDATFGGDGKVMTDFTPTLDNASGVAIQADGRIVVVGDAAWGRKFALARYNGDGTLDASFGGDGKVMTDFTSGSDFAHGVAIQADGRIVAAGVAGDLSGHSRFALARYDSDGSLDVTFGGDGKVMTSGYAWGDAANGVAIQADGKIVAAGSSRSQGRFALARYDSDGSLDASFGDGGKVETDFRDHGAIAVVIQADGRIVAAGIANEGFRSKVNLALARYLGR